MVQNFKIDVAMFFEICFYLIQQVKWYDVLHLPLERPIEYLHQGHSDLPKSEVFAQIMLW